MAIMMSKMISLLRLRSVLVAPTRVLRTRSGTVASGVGSSAMAASITGVAVGWGVEVGAGTGVEVGVAVGNGSASASGYWWAPEWALE